MQNQNSNLFRWLMLIGITMIGVLIILTAWQKPIETGSVSVFIPHVDTSNAFGDNSSLRASCRLTAEISSYNAGDVNQTDDDPCISASGEDICFLLEQGEKICANNYLPFDTMIFIEGYGVCRIADRMNSRYEHANFDIAFKFSEKQEAKDFGRQALMVWILQD